MFAGILWLWYSYVEWYQIDMMEWSLMFLFILLIIKLKWNEKNEIK